MSDNRDDLRRMANFIGFGRGGAGESGPPQWLTDLQWPELADLDAQLLASAARERARSDAIFRAALAELLRDAGLSVTVQLWRTHVENRRLPLRLQDV
jgi:hypothetical protein